jgi:hypothetical protein
MERVCILEVNDGRVTAKHADSYARMYHYERSKPQTDQLLERKIGQYAYINIVRAQNRTVEEFMESNCDWALMLESDIVYPENLLERLVSSAQEHDATVMGGLYIQPNRNIPLLFTSKDDDPVNNTSVMLDYPDDVVKVVSTGVGCLLMHRTALEAIYEGPLTWFREEPFEGSWVQADTNICWRFNDAGHQVYVDCRIELGHDKYGRVWVPKDMEWKKGVTQYA